MSAVPSVLIEAMELLQRWSLTEADPSLQPPKKWWNKMKKKIKKSNPGYSDDQVRRTIGSIWYKKVGTAKRKEIRGREGKTYG